MSSFSNFLMLSAICVSPILMNNICAANEFVSITGLPSNDIPSVVTTTIAPALPNREDLLSALKYVKPILESRIEYCEQILPLFADLKKSITEKYALEFRVTEPSKLQRTVAAKLATEISDKKKAIQSLSNIDFTRLQIQTDHYLVFFLDNLCKRKEKDKFANNLTLALYQDILESLLDKEKCFKAVDMLYAQLSLLIKLSKSKTAFSDGKPISTQEEIFFDDEYYEIILNKIRPYCSKEAQRYACFFSPTPAEEIATIKIDQYLQKCMSFFDEIKFAEHNMMGQIEEKAADITQELFEQIKKRNRNVQRLKIELNLNITKNQTNLNTLSQKALKVSFQYLSELYHTSVMACDLMHQNLFDLLQKYEYDLDQIGCVHKPTFISACHEILAQPDYDPLADLNEVDDALLSIDEKLSRLHLNINFDEESNASVLVIDEETEIEKLDPNTEKKSGASKKKKKSKKKTAGLATVDVTGDESEAESGDDELEGVKTDSTLSQQASQPDMFPLANNLESTDHISQKSTPLNNTYVKTLRADRSEAIAVIRKTSKVVSEKGSVPYKNDKGKKSENIAEPATSTPEMKKPSAPVCVPAIDVAPWITTLLTAREHDFKETIRTLYYELSTMGLSPEFLTRKEKFVFGFISPLTRLPFAITYDIPHGSQLLKGNAAGWIKKIKYCLKDQGVIPS